MSKAPCGTTAAYSRHCRWGEVPDEACLAAHRAYKARLRARRRAEAELLLGRRVPHWEVPHILANYG